MFTHKKIVARCTQLMRGAHKKLITGRETVYDSPTFVMVVPILKLKLILKPSSHKYVRYCYLVSSIALLLDRAAF